MENSLIGPIKSERIMWFSMWFLAAIVTFGAAFFPLFYRSIERRNQHFKRQHEVEEKAAALLPDQEGDLQSEKPPLQRNEIFWTASIILVVPAFAALYVLSNDLVLHEKNQQIFLKRILPHMDYKPQRISIGMHVLITVATLGLGGIYWLYRVFNSYNNHFREHRIIDDEINRFMEAGSHGESV
jgi:hypothetical protein